MKRTFNERKHNTWTKIRKKLNFIKATNSLFNHNARDFVEEPHRLAKDKLEGRTTNQHTNNKTKRHIPGNYQKTKNWSARDQRQLDKMDVEE